LEKICQATGVQRALDGDLAVPLAELPFLDMGMRDVARFSGGIWLKGDHVVAPTLPNSVPKQADLKGTEVDVFQHDRLGVHGDRLVCQIDGERVEFVG
jgi:hypothetical protein